jgi:hypothetical protein
MKNSLGCLGTISILIFFATVKFTEGAEARITRVVQDVKLLRAPDPPRSASLNETVRNGTAVRTGVDSQGELTFDDRTLARLGSDTIFSFREGTRSMDLGRGAMLLRVPRGAGNAKITTANVTSVVTGTTCLLEYYPQGYIKLIVLEGTARMFMPARLGESVLIKEGQLLMFHVKPAPTSLPNPVDIDLKRLMATSLLIQGFPPLGSEGRIAQGMQDQKKQKSKGALVDTNLVIFGRGTLVSLLPPTGVEGADQKPAAVTPTPTPTPRPGR